MQPWNKNSLISGAVVFTIALVVFSTIMCIYGFFTANVTWAALILPITAIAYGCVSFVKKYYRKDKVGY